MSELKHYLRKHEFPLCAKEALSNMEQLCCQGNTPQQQKLIQELMEEFVFCEIDRRGIRKKKLNALQELQLLDILSNYFEGQRNQVVSNTVFLTLFHHHAGSSAYKLTVMTKLISMAISMRSALILNGSAVWMQQQGCTSDVVITLARELVKDYLHLFPKAMEYLRELPKISLHFTAHFITAMTPMYGRADESRILPPAVLLRCITRWITDNPRLCLAPLLTNLHGVLPKGSIVMSACVPLPGLIRWCVEAPLLEDNKALSDKSVIYSQLHLAVLESMAETPKLRERMNQQDVMFTKDFIGVCESAAAAIQFAERNFLESANRIRLSVDRLAQALQISLSSGCLRGNLDEIRSVLMKLPPNRLIKMVLYH